MKTRITSGLCRWNRIPIHSDNPLWRWKIQGVGLSCWCSPAHESRLCWSVAIPTALLEKWCKNTKRCCFVTMRFMMRLLLGESSELLYTRRAKLDTIQPMMLLIYSTIPESHCSWPTATPLVPQTALSRTNTSRRFWRSRKKMKILFKQISRTFQTMIRTWIKTKGSHKWRRLCCVG
jgi:hypothetical protein